LRKKNEPHAPHVLQKKAAEKEKTLREEAPISPKSPLETSNTPNVVSDTPNVDKEVEQPPSTQVDTPQVGISTEQSEPPKPTAEEKPETSADTITAVVPNSAENSDAENTAKVATRKLLIPTVFDPSRQQEAEEEAKKNANKNEKKSSKKPAKENLDNTANKCQSRAMAQHRNLQFRKLRHYWKMTILILWKSCTKIIGGKNNSETTFTYM